MLGLAADMVLGAMLAAFQKNPKTKKTHRSPKETYPNQIQPTEKKKKNKHNPPKISQDSQLYVQV